MKILLKDAAKLVKPFRVTGSEFRLKDFDPGETLDLTTDDKPDARLALHNGVDVLSCFQNRLYAQNEQSLLIIFQAMDAAGKDSAIKHVMSGVNPQGCRVHSFKAPSTEELAHDYLWRCQKCLPAHGEITIFNRSYYEETLVVRIHPEFLAKQRLPKDLVTKHIWDERFKDIRQMEKRLTRNGTRVLKFFLHVSKGEQKRRFLKRLEQPEKYWKFSPADLKERELWKKYQHAYEEMIRNTATESAPWIVVPADHKWFAHMIISAAIVDTLGSMGLAYPVIDPATQKSFAAIRRQLLKT